VWLFTAVRGIVWQLAVAAAASRSAKQLVLPCNLVLIALQLAPN
jgi:hypothetical protein